MKVETLTVVVLLLVSFSAPLPGLPMEYFNFLINRGISEQRLWTMWGWVADMNHKGF